MIDNIYYALVFFVEVLISYLYCEAKYSRKVNKITLRISLFAMYVILYFSRTFENVFINLIMFFICNFLLMFLFYHTNKLSCMFHSSLLLILMSVTEIVVYLISSSILQKNTLSVLDNSTNLIFQTTISKTLYFIFAYMMSKFSSKEKKDEESKSFYLFILPLSSTLVLYSLFLIINESKIPQKHIRLLIGSTILLLVSNVIVFLVYEFALKTYRKNIKLEVQQQKDKSMSEYYSLLNQKNEDTKIIVHDFKRHLNTIKSFSDESGQVASYIDNIMDDFKVNVEVNYCNNPLLNLITNKYQAICDDLNIKFSTDIRTAQIEFMDGPDITALFDNLLENAVEAARQTSIPFVDFIIHIRNDKYLVIKIANSLSKRVNIRKNHIVSSKDSNGIHGVGLKSIRRVVNKYNGEFFMDFREKNMMFISKITFEIDKNFEEEEE